MADERRILAEGLLGAPPAGITGDIEHGRKALMRADAAPIWPCALLNFSYIRMLLVRMDWLGEPLPSVSR